MSNVSLPSALLTVAVLAGCTPAGKEPRLASGLHQWGNEDATAAALKRFPLGTPESRLISELKEDHFKIDPVVAGTSRHATADWGDAVCNLHYELKWQADTRANLSNLSASFHEAGCL